MFFKGFNEESDIKAIILQEGGRYQHLGALSHHILRGSSPLTVGQRELLAAYVSVLNECQYCTGTHMEVASKFGVNDSLLQSILTDIDSASISDELRPILHFAKKLTLTPNKMIQQDAETVFRVGWSEQALKDTIAVVCLFSFYNRLLDGYGVKGSKFIFDEGANHLKKRGYRIGWIPRFLYKIGVIK